MFLENLLELQRDLDGLFGEELFSGATYSRGTFPSINIFEKNDALVLKAELPGFKKKDLKIEIGNNTISLSGKREAKPQNDVTRHRIERESGEFSRVFRLPYKVNAEKASATFEDGVLSIELAKVEEEKTKAITIR